MAEEYIEESGMCFGPFEANRLLHLEKSPLYTALGKGVKIADFAILRGIPDKATLVIVEAKSSSPRPGSGDDFEQYVAAVASKLCNSLDLIAATVLGRHTGRTQGLPIEFLSADLSTVRVALVLVVRGHPPEYLPPLQDAVGRALHGKRKACGLGPNPVAVLNEELAQSKGLIAPAG